MKPQFQQQQEQMRRQQEQMRKQQEELRHRQEMAVYYEQQKAKQAQQMRQNQTGAKDGINTGYPNNKALRLQSGAEQKLRRANLSDNPQSHNSSYTPIPSYQTEVHPFRAIFSLIWNLILTAVFGVVAVIIIAEVTNDEVALEVLALCIIGLIGLIVSIRRTIRIWNGE
jgi:hypothetical protein